MSGCIYVDPDMFAEVYREEMRRAAKEHTCTECGDPILIGDLHEYATGLWDGRWSSYRTCARCLLVRADYFRNWTFTMMVEDFWDAHGIDYRDGIPDYITPCGR